MLHPVIKVEKEIIQKLETTHFISLVFGKVHGGDLFGAVSFVKDVECFETFFSDEGCRGSIANGTIWAITFVSTASVLSGLDAGIKFLSQLAFLLGMVLLAFVFIADDTKFFLNMIVQQIGFYLQWGIFELNFWTDAYAQLKPGSGRAVDGNAGAQWWMNAWLIFYQAWWVSWSAFVGLFVARISRGRTIGQVVTYSMVAPILYCIVWFRYVAFCYPLSPPPLFKR